MHALIVDDARVMRLLLSKILKSLGFEVTEAANGREGLELLECRGATDVALVDCNMPEMDGYAFVDALRSRPKFQALPVLMVTAEEGPAQAARVAQAGAQGFVPKPFTESEMVAKLHQIGVLGR
jgi:two-component system chemotaxis response regulator CheY